jgi:hypothetical protein
VAQDARGRKDGPHKEEKMSQEGKPGASAHEPFVPPSDHPAVKPDSRLSDATVQDLLDVMRGNPILHFNKHHADLKAFYSKHEQWKAEHIKIELWKLEHPEFPPGQNGPDPQFAQLAQGIEGLRAQVQNLSSEVAALRKSATT